MKLLLDTHVLVWWVGDERRLSRAQRRALSRVDSARPALVATISLWEIGVLVGAGRVRLDLPVREWLESATAPPRVQLVDLTPAIAAEVSRLPATLHRDPADRILLATARVHRATLLTRDERLLACSLVDGLG